MDFQDHSTRFERKKRSLRLPLMLRPPEWSPWVISQQDRFDLFRAVARGA
jgi:hypothetical protein